MLELGQVVEKYLGMDITIIGEIVSLNATTAMGETGAIAIRVIVGSDGHKMFTFNNKIKEAVERCNFKMTDNETYHVTTDKDELNQVENFVTENVDLAQAEFERGVTVMVNLNYDEEDCWTKCSGLEPKEWINVGAFKIVYETEEPEQAKVPEIDKEAVVEQIQGLLQQLLK